MLPTGPLTHVKVKYICTTNYKLKILREGDKYRHSKYKRNRVRTVYTPTKGEQLQYQNYLDLDKQKNTQT